MVEYGFLDNAIHSLPDDFSLVYEIARVLEDITHPLTNVLSPVLWLAEPDLDSKINSHRYHTASSCS